MAREGDRESGSTMTRNQFAKALEHEPEHVQPWGRNILKNLAVIESPKTGADDREAARIQLGKNLAQFEKLRAGT